MSKNGIYIKLIHTARWRALRKSVLLRSPECVHCQRAGRIAIACEVHHIKPCELATSRGEMERLMFDPSNLVALCHDCHVKAHVAMKSKSKAEVARRRAAETAAMISNLFGEPGAIFLRGTPSGR